jgi:hypothetical protein
MSEEKPERGAEAQLEDALGGQGRGAMAAADDLRRTVRRASWRPRAVLRRLWRRLRTAWRGP